MPIATHTLTGDFNSIIGEVSKVIATVHTNSEDGGWVNETDLKVTLGGAKIPVAADGTFTVTLPTSTGTGLQYEIRVTYVDPALVGIGQGRKSWRSGWFDLTANSNLAERALNSTLRVAQSLSTQLSGRIDGVDDHGSVSGAVSIDSDISTHWLDATGATVLSLTDGPSGEATRYVSVLVISGAEDVTVTDLPDVTLTDGTFATFAWVRGAWILAGSGGSSEPPVTDTTPPSNVTGLTATGGSGQIVLDWNNSTDTESTVSYRYRVWLTSAGAGSTAWTTTTTSAATVTGLAAGAYTAEVYAYSAGGSTATVSATATVTAPLTTDFLDTFTRGGASTNINASPTPDVGSNWGGSATGSSTISGGRLTTVNGGYLFASRSVAAREITVIAATPTSGEVSFGAQANSGTMSTGGFTAQFNSVGRVYTNLTSVSYNVTGGTNPYTTNGYLTAGDHTLKITHNGTLTTVYVDDVKVLEGTSATPSNHAVTIYAAGVTTVDRIEVKS